MAEGWLVARGGSKASSAHHTHPLAGPRPAAGRAARCPQRPRDQTRPAARNGGRVGQSVPGTKGRPGGTVASDSTQPAAPTERTVSCSSLSSSSSRLPMEAGLQQEGGRREQVTRHAGRRHRRWRRSIDAAGRWMLAGAATARPRVAWADDVGLLRAAGGCQAQARRSRAAGVAGGLREALRWPWCQSQRAIAAGAAAAIACKADFLGGSANAESVRPLATAIAGRGAANCALSQPLAVPARDGPREHGTAGWRPRVCPPHPPSLPSDQRVIANTSSTAALLSPLLASRSLLRQA